MLEPTPAQLRGVTEFLKTSKSWTRIRIASINYVIYPSELEINVRVSGLVYKNVDLEPYVTAGIGLYFSESLRYAFRLSVNHTYPRVVGPYSTEEELCKAMLAALTLAQGEAAAKPPQEVPPPVFPAALLMPAAPAAVASAASVAAPDPATEKALQQLSAIAGDLAALKAENERLKAELDILRKAVLTLSNLGIFGDVRTVDSAGIQKILALKKEKPELLQDEVADILRKENYKLTSYEIFLVFSVYFNEFR